MIQSGFKVFELSKIHSNCQSLMKISACSNNCIERDRITLFLLLIVPVLSIQELQNHFMPSRKSRSAVFISKLRVSLPNPIGLTCLPNEGAKSEIPCIVSCID